MEMNCKACNLPGVRWNKSEGKWDYRCTICNYYQYSVMSPKMFNYLKIEGNALILYSKLLDK